jgi:hypothetical protein
MTHRLALFLLPWTIAAVIALLSLGGCRDTNKSSEMHRWDLIAEGENKELYFLDRKATTRVSEGVVRVSVKYVPSKDQFLTSLKEISKQFGGEGKEADYEYTVSTWEFDCTGGQGRCLGLVHFRKGQKIASYDYPEQKWSPLDKTTSTKVLRDLVCRQTKEARN